MCVIIFNTSPSLASGMSNSGMSDCLLFGVLPFVLSFGFLIFFFIDIKLSGHESSLHGTKTSFFSETHSCCWPFPIETIFPGHMWASGHPQGYLRCGCTSYNSKSQKIPCLSALLGVGCKATDTCDVASRAGYGLLLATDYCWLRTALLRCWQIKAMIKLVDKVSKSR